MKPLPLFSHLAVLLLTCLGVATARAQNLSYSMVPNGTIDIVNNSGGTWFFTTNPSPAAATMSKCTSDGLSEYPWTGNTVSANFYNDPNNFSNRILGNQILRVHANTVPTGSTITIAYATGPVDVSTLYTISISVITPGAQVTSLNRLDPTPTAANSVRWEAIFNNAVTGVTAANFSFTNSANIQPKPTVTSVAPTVAGDNTKWTVTASTAGTGTGILTLNWKGHASESPAAPAQFTGQSYDFSILPIIDQYPVVQQYVQPNATPATLTVVAHLRNGASANYQWKRGTSTNPGGAVSITGATSASYTPPTSSTVGSTQYYCRVWSGASETNYWADTTTSTVTFQNPAAITGHPAAATVTTKNATATLSVTATGTSVEYQWYRGNSGVTTSPINGATSASFTTPALTANTSYWVRAFNGLPGGANSTTAAVTVIDHLTSSGTYTPTVGATLSGGLSAQAIDSAGQPVQNVSLKFAGPGGALSGVFGGSASSATVSTGSTGTATTPAYTAGTKAGALNVVVTVGDALPYNLAVTNLPGPMTQLKFTSRPPSTATAGVVFTQQAALLLFDAYSNVCTNDSATAVTMAVNFGTAALQGTTTVSANAGLAYFPNLSYNKAETITLKATAGALTELSTSIVVSPAAASSIVATGGLSQVAAPGGAFTSPLALRLTDAYGNPIAGATVTFTEPANGASAVLSAHTVQTDGSGNASVNATANALPGMYAVRANISPALGSPAAFSLTNFDALQMWRYTNFAGDYLGAGNGGDMATPFGDGVPNLFKYAFNLNPQGPDATPMTDTGTKGLPYVGHDATGRLVIKFVRRKAAGNPAISYAVETGTDLQTWTALSLSGATVQSIDATWERVAVTDPTVTPRRVGRVRVRDLSAYANDFNAGLGAASLRGSAAWSNGAVVLTTNAGGQTGAVVLDGIAASPALSGFTAQFALNISIPDNNGPADGVSFVVGDLGSGAWGESGPATAQSLAVGFDTYNNGFSDGNAGIHLWVNGAHVAVNGTNPFTFGATVPVEISYDAATGVSVKFNGATIFSNVATPGFSFPANGRFGLGGRTGGFYERAVVDDIVITPR